MKNIFALKFILIFSLILTGCGTGSDNATPTVAVEATNTPSQSPTDVPTDVPVATETRAPMETPVPVNTVAPPTTSIAFPVGPGGVDVIPHQIVRTKDDHLYIFSSAQDWDVVRTYRTLNPGFPESAADFAPAIEFTESRNIISVDAVYDGGNIIHVIINTLGGEAKDYPFDTTTNSYKPAITLATDGGVIAYGMYVGTSGVTGMVDLNGTIHFAYWRNNNHILHRAYTYDSASNSLTPTGDFFQVDTSGNANHPVLAVSPKDNSVTIAWVSEADSPAKILTRARANNGSWGSVESASTASVWIFHENGINIDQGPSLLIDSTGMKHMTYIESCCVLGGGVNAEYGLVHYVTDSGSGWVDTTLSIFTHDPAMAQDSSGNLYIIGHGHPNNSAGDSACRSSMDNMCYIKKVPGGSWGDPILVATPPGNSFDSSPSVKWSVVGFNRPEVVEFIFFMTPYDKPTVYYARLP